MSVAAPAHVPWPSCARSRWWSLPNCPLRSLALRRRPDLNQRAEFWRRLWAILFVAITTTVCVAQRDRLVPIYTGIRSLYNGGSGGGEAGVTYQRVATDTHVKGQGKFAVADLEDEYDDAAFGDSAAL